MTELGHTKNAERKLQLSLLALRLTIAWFLMQWVLDKFLNPDHTARIFAFFYKVPIDISLSPVIGSIQLIVVTAFLLGFMKPISYGAVALMHTVTTLSTWKSILMPFAEGSNQLFSTGVPVLAACWALFALREHDVLLSFDAWRDSRKNNDS
tara:strand:- start:2169 stop:2624 length:456 start_codon:yes stop_codon:yes gene_type:complete